MRNHLAALCRSATHGTIERIHQDRQQRFIMMRLLAPAPGVALVGTYDAGPRINASMSIYFYGDDADARAAASEQKWRDWLGKRFAPEASDQSVRGSRDLLSTAVQDPPRR